MTVQRDGNDLDTAAVLPKLNQFLSEHCTHGVFAVEKGGREELLHIQGVVRTRFAPTASAFSKKMNSYLGFTGVNKELGNTRTKKLTGKKMHTFNGLVAYCRKDRKKAHYHSVSKNITNAMIRDGTRLFDQHRASEMRKSGSVITSYNIFEKMVNHYRLYSRHNRQQVNSEDVLVSMYRTGKFYPDAKWFIERSGQGMRRERFLTAWKVVSNPKSTDVSDVRRLHIDRLDWPARLHQPPADSQLLADETTDEDSSVDMNSDAESSSSIEDDDDDDDV